MLTDGFDDIVIPTRADLYLYAFIPGVELGLDLLQKLLDRVLNADRNAAFYLGAYAADVPPERMGEFFGLKVPASSLNTRLGHTMAADLFHRVPNLFRRLKFFPDDHR